MNPTQKYSGPSFFALPYLFWKKLTPFLGSLLAPIQLHSSAFRNSNPSNSGGNFKEFVTLHHNNYVNLFRVLSLFKVTARVGCGQSDCIFVDLSICSQTISNWGKHGMYTNNQIVMLVQYSNDNLHCELAPARILESTDLRLESPWFEILWMLNRVWCYSKLIWYPTFLEVIKTLDFLQAVMKARSKDTWAVDEARIEWKSNIRGHPTIKVLHIALDTTSYSWASSRTIPSLFQHLIISAASYVTRLVH